MRELMRPGRLVLCALLITCSSALAGAGQPNTPDSTDLTADVASLKAEVRLLQLRVTELFQLRDREIALASEAVDKRLAQMNEFRAQLDKQAGTFATREAMELQHQQMVKQ